MSVEFYIDGWEEFTARCEALVDKWEEKKLSLMQKMAKVCLEEITPLIPVDTSNLVSKFQVGVVTPDEAEIGTNVHYALYVNDGHVQRKRFLPISYLSANGRKKYVHTTGKKGKDGTGGGIMLKEKYIPGVHFLENGMQSAEPRLQTLGDSFMEQIGREIEGAGM